MSTHDSATTPERCPRCTAPNLRGANFCAACGARMHGEDVTPGAVDPWLSRVLLGRYRLLRLLGEGGMGRVYLAEQRMGTVHRHVAIKLLQLGAESTPGARARFERECELVVQLSHPNTIQVHDFGALDDGTLFIVMEYLKGPSLAAALRDGAMPEARVEAIVEQICGSLDEAHRRGIVHRDLKPENVLLTERAGRPDFVKVLDFGIAKRTESGVTDKPTLTRQGMVLGTPPYMSPEQFVGAAVDARSDVYSLAVMTYEMLTGELPFAAVLPWEWAHAHTSVEPAAFETRPAGARVASFRRDAVLHALSKRRDARPAGVMEFLAEFTGRVAAPARREGAGARSNPTVPVPELVAGGVPRGALPPGEVAAVPGRRAGARNPTFVGNGKAHPGASLGPARRRDTRWRAHVGARRYCAAGAICTE